MKKHLLLIIFILLILPLIKPKEVSAQTLSFEPSTLGVVNGNQFTVKININTGGKETSGAEAMILFDSSILSIESVSNGGFYTYFGSNPISGTSNKYLISGYEQDSTSYKTGTGTLAQIVFAAKANGTSSVSFECTSAKVDSNIYEGSTANDIINCGSLTQANYTVGPSNATPVSDGTSGDTTTPPVAGSTEVTVIALGVGAILFVAGLLILF